MTRRFLLFTLGVFIISMSCSKSPKCWGEDENNGDIIESYSLPSCFYLPVQEDGSFLARSTDDIDTLDGCTVSPLQIDFTKYSIIGFPTEFQCNAKIIREVIIDHNNKQCGYSITINECGLCKSMGINDNLVLIPALPEDYLVIFKVEYK